MQAVTLILWSIIAIVFLLCIMSFVKRAETDDVVTIPQHVSMESIDSHTSQEVFDWCVYVTRVSGKDYLDKLQWTYGSRHDFLLSDLRAARKTQGEKQLLRRFDLIAASFGLDSHVVHMPV